MKHRARLPEQDAVAPSLGIEVTICGEVLQFLDPCQTTDDIGCPGRPTCRAGQSQQAANPLHANRAQATRSKGLGQETRRPPPGRSGSSRSRVSLTAGPLRPAISRVSVLPGPAPTAQRDIPTLEIRRRTNLVTTLPSNALM